MKLQIGSVGKRDVDVSQNWVRDFVGKIDHVPETGIRHIRNDAVASGACSEAFPDHCCRRKYFSRTHFLVMVKRMNSYGQVRVLSSQQRNFFAFLKAVCWS